MEDESSIISRLLTDLENQPISRSTLRELLSLLSIPPDEFTPNMFEEMSRGKVPLTELVSSISSVMDSSSSVSLSLLASNTYLSLLLYDNAPVFTLFTPIAFLSLLRAIRRCFKSARVNVNDGSGQKVGRGGNKVRKRGKGKEAAASEDAEEGGESEFDVKDLFECLKKLEKVLGLVHLDRFPDSLKSLIQTAGEIPIMAMDLNFGGSYYDRVTGLCCGILKESLNVEHGDQANAAAEVLKSLSMSILMHKSNARTFALGFVRDVIVGLGKECDGIKKALVNLPRYLSLKAPERSEQRALAVESITEIVRVMEFGDQIGFLDYALKMSRGKASLRLLAVDMILVLLTTLDDPLGVNSEEGERNLWGLTCLEALVQRCSDVVAGIRARALSNLAQFVGFLSNCSKSKGVLREVMGFGNEGGQTFECGMNDLLRKRCMDEKAAVRKAALLLISKLTALLGGAFDEQVLKTMGISCSDPLVSIRKAAMSALSEAFRAFSNEKVTSEWLLGVPRLITDNETTIQEECGNLFLELVLDRISRAGSHNSLYKGSLKDDSNVKDKNIERDVGMQFPEGILGLLKDICSGEVMPWVKKICTSLGKKKRLKPQLAIALQNIIKTSESVWLGQEFPMEKWTAPPGAWFLLSEVSAFLPKAVDWEFLHHHWKLLGNCEKWSAIKGPIGQADMHGEVLLENDSVAWAGDRVFLLQTISNVSVELPQEPAADLAHNLLKRIRDFNMHPTEINAHVMALRTLCKQKALNPDEADILVKKWATKLISKASRVVESYASGKTEAEEDNGLVTPTVIVNRKGEKSSTLSEAISALYTIGSVVIVCPSADLKTIIPVLHTIITSGKSDKKPKGLSGPLVPIKQISLSLYIHAWLTMGKICLADGKLAKSYIPLFVQELENSDCAALRSNLVVMMADFCVRHTALVDCYISKITKCLRDPCELVRRQTFILLSRLLQRDYVKWRGVLFLRFLLSLVDDSEKIRQLADFLFGNILKAKAPLLAYNSFVEAIYVLNDCRSHSGHNDYKSSRSESLLFSIRGDDENSRAKRMHIYVSLLKQMAPEHLLATFAKVCAEILASASDGMLNIEDIGGQCALQDAFQILACKEIRILPNRGSSSDAAEMEEEGGDSGGASSSAVRGKFITQAIKKGLIQNTIPIFIELKRLLESKNSRLIGSLMECLRVLLKDYKHEIDEILVADKQLQKELIYDMQKYETDKAKSVAAKAISRTSVAKSPKYTASNAESLKSAANKKASFEKNVHKNSTFHPPTSMHNESSHQSNSRVASAMADAVAAATAKSVLKEVNQGALTPPLSAISVPKLRSTVGGISARVDRPDKVLASLRRRHNFDSDEES